MAQPPESYDVIGRRIRPRESYKRAFCYNQSTFLYSILPTFTVSCDRIVSVTKPNTSDLCPLGQGYPNDLTKEGDFRYVPGLNVAKKNLTIAKKNV